MSRGVTTKLIAAAVSVIAAAPAGAEVLFEENFDTVALGPIVTFGDSDSRGELPSREAWSNVPPAGWTRDDSGVPGDPVNDGVREFRGWTFVDKQWWTDTAGDQNRSSYTFGYGVVAVADNDEFDDFSLGSGEGRGPSPDGCSAGDDCYDTSLTTPAISLAGVGANQARVVFDSSWRPEDQQDASLEVSFDGGPFTTLFTWNSVNADGSEPDLSGGGSTGQGLFTKVSDANGVQIGDLLPDNSQVNEVVDVALNNPSGASDVRVRWNMFDAGNDWWWAVDNIQVYTDTPGPRDPALKVVVDPATGNVSIVNGTSRTIDLKGYQISSTAGSFDADAASFLSGADADWVRLSEAGAGGDLSEGHLSSSAIAPGDTLDLGEAWLPYFQLQGDIGFQYIDEELGTVPGLVAFEGGDIPPFLDLNFDFVVDILDWVEFLAITDTVDLSDLTAAQAYRKGDLDGDLRLTISDFVTFQRTYDALNGAGAFEAAVAGLGVPEPGATTLLALAFAAAGLGLRRR